MRRTIHTLIAIPLALAGALTAGSAYAQVVICDFITGGGWVIADNDIDPTREERVNFGAHAGCRRGAFWGHVNVVDHSFQVDPNTGERGKFKSTEITAYFRPVDPNAHERTRDICGRGVVTGAGLADDVPVKFRARLEDNGQGGLDRFGLVLALESTPPPAPGVPLAEFYRQNTRDLGPPGAGGGGGSVKLHKEGKSPAPILLDPFCFLLAPP
jgi:hypothetical protein